MGLHITAAIYAIFAAGGGAMIGSIFDTPGAHTDAQVIGVIAAIGAYVWRVSRG